MSTSNFHSMPNDPLACKLAGYVLDEIKLADKEWWPVYTSIYFDLIGLIGNGDPWSRQSPELDRMSMESVDRVLVIAKTQERRRIAYRISLELQKANAVKHHVKEKLMERSIRPELAGLICTRCGLDFQYSKSNHHNESECLKAMKDYVDLTRETKP